jgi:NAD(P)H dehydrogenase (quinone)
MTVAVAGASGYFSGLTAELLLERLSPDEVILITRNPERVAPRLRESGAIIREADFEAADSLRGAFDGADRALVMSVDHNVTPHRVEAHRAAFQAAADAGVKHIAFPSMPRVDENHPTSTYAMEYPESEKVLEELGVDWTVLQNAPYAEGLIPRGAMAIASGQLTSNAGDGQTAPVSHADCAAVAVSVLLDDGHAGQNYVVTGPELFTQAQLAELFAEISGKPVELAEVDDDDHGEILRQAGIPEPFDVYLPRHLKAIRLGYFDDLNDVVKTVTGKDPDRVQDILAANRDALLGA